MRSIKAPVVHFHTGDSCLPRSVMVALEVLRKEGGMVTIQSPYETFVPGSYRARFWSATARRRMRAVVSPSRHATEFQVRCGVPTALAFTVPNSVDIDAVSHGDGTGPRAALGIGPGDPVVLFCSRLDSQKRPLEAVQIFDGVAREFPSAVLVFVGQGSQQEAVELEAERLGIRDRVRMVGYQTTSRTGSRRPRCGCCPRSARTSAWPCWKDWPPGAPCSPRRAAATTRCSSIARTP